MSPPSSEHLVEAAVESFQAGREREASFRRLVEAFYGPLRAFFLRRVREPEDALELTQETFLRIYRALDGFRREASFRSWAFGIAHTTYFKWLERRGSGDAAPAAPPATVAATADGGWEGLEPVAVERRTPLDDLLAREARDRLAAAIEGLPAQERRCVLLRVYQDLSHPEIAELLGLAVGTVKAHLHHARQKLQARLRDDFREIEP